MFCLVIMGLQFCGFMSTVKKIFIVESMFAPPSCQSTLKACFLSYEELEELTGYYNA